MARITFLKISVVNDLFNYANIQYLMLKTALSSCQEGSEKVSALHNKEEYCGIFKVTKSLRGVYTLLGFQVGKVRAWGHFACQVWVS